jgi:uncharacterized BrkB/YihY/UPF0761 family membrane protein
MLWNLAQALMTLDSLRSALADIVTITQRAFVNFEDHECAQRSAALSYYALFAMFLLMLLAISTVGFVLEAGIPLAVHAQAVALKAVEQTLPQAEELVEHILSQTRLPLAQRC